MTEFRPLWPGLRSDMKHPHEPQTLFFDPPQRVTLGDSAENVLYTRLVNMQMVGRRTLGVVMTLLVSTLLTACNIDGFFTKFQDDPAWVDPNAAAKEAAGTADAGGPGKAVYSRKCATCHQGTGKGVPGTYPPLVGSEIANGDPTYPIRIVLHGFRGPIERQGTAYNNAMASWKALSDQEIADVLTYVRSSTLGNSGAPVTPDEVKAVREATASRATPYTEAELLQ